MKRLGVLFLFLAGCTASPKMSCEEAYNMMFNEAHHQFLMDSCMVKVAASCEGDEHCLYDGQLYCLENYLTDKLDGVKSFRDGVCYK